ncbi:MAG: hypothetical protein H6834_09380 [Planctomycetes bacterium]|nr:hypothetical protein [Planctomycetota bacterium]
MRRRRDESLLARVRRVLPRYDAGFLALASVLACFWWFSLTFLVLVASIRVLPGKTWMDDAVDRDVAFTIGGLLFACAGGYPLFRFARRWALLAFLGVNLLITVAWLLVRAW